MDTISLKKYSNRLLTAPLCEVFGGNILKFLEITSTATAKNIIFFAGDHHGDVFDIIPPIRRFSVVNDIRKKVLDNPNQNFWIFHSWLNYDSYFGQSLPNLKLIKYADEVWIQGDRTQYSTVDPQFEKNFNSTRHWISLGANRRVARYIAAMYLLGTSATSKGLLKIDPTEILEHESWESYLSYWKFNECNEIFNIESSFPTLKNGFDKIKCDVEYETRIYSPATVPTVSHKNFDEFLRILYQDSFIEIVNETMFMETSGVVTEKFINSVYGYNLPIILNVSNTVSYLRSLGFDMFDDVIDHRYDTVVDPLARLVQALSSNIALLQDGDLAKNAWRKCQDRMKNNVELAKQLELDMPDRVTSLLISLNDELSQ
jgi:hypothetical protein